jgi:hypothetical protein
VLVRCDAPPLPRNLPHAILFVRISLCWGESCGETSADFHSF